MTPPLAPTLPPWPVLDEKDYGDPLFERDVYIDHLKALAAAWEARARLAVEALADASPTLHAAYKRAATKAELTGEGAWEEQRDLALESSSIVDKALIIVGPLPPLPDLTAAEKGE